MFEKLDKNSNFSTSFDYLCIFRLFLVLKFILLLNYIKIDWLNKIDKMRIIIVWCTAIENASMLTVSNSPSHSKGAQELIIDNKSTFPFVPRSISSLFHKIDLERQ